MRETTIKRLHWGCGSWRPSGWINSDSKEGPGIDISCDIRDGLPLDTGSIDYAVSIHALPEVPYPDLVPVLGELRRVLKPAGPLILTTPDHPRSLLVRLALKPERFDEHFSPYADHLRFFTVRTLRRVLDDAGFATVAMTRAKGHLLACAF